MDYTSYREELLRSIKQKRKYVTVTPYFTNVYGKRTNINMFTTLEFTSFEVRRKVETEKAVQFIRDMVSAREEHALAQGENPLWASVSCEVSYFVDSEIRKDKNRDVEWLSEDEVLAGVNCVTVGYELLKDGVEFYDRRTFVVDLDEFCRLLLELDYVPTFETRGISEEMRSEVLENGLSASRELTFIKNHKIKEATM